MSIKVIEAKLAVLWAKIKAFFVTEEDHLKTFYHEEFAPGVDEVASIPASTTVPVEPAANA